VHRILSLAAIAGLIPVLPAQTVQVPLNYNFNGIVHAGENGQPDAPNGFRSISDRALDFRSGVPNDPVLARYRLVGTPGVLDIVHLGNRNTVSGGVWAFETVANGNDIGIRPNWLPVVDQSGPQTTVLTTPLLMGSTSTASFLFQISNGGGSFTVTFTYQSNRIHTATLTGPDWFGGTYAGTANVDRALPGGNLNVTEQVVDLSADAGETLTRIAFSNRSNQSGDYAILAANVDPAPVPMRVNQITLNYNFNGIVHAGESGQPDALNGFRSVSDRALDFSAGVPNLPLLAPYFLVSTPGVPDLVHLGNRNTVAQGTLAFDPVPNANDIGIQPAWLTNPDQTGPQTTQLQAPILLDSASSASVLFQLSNGGGSFDVTFHLRGGGAITATLTGPDWLTGGTFPGADHVDSGLPGASLAITQRSVSLGAAAGLVLTSMTFDNRSNPNGACAILAVNVAGCLACPGGGGPSNLGGGNGPTMSTTSTGHLGCDLEWTVAGATPNTPLGFFTLGLGSGALPLNTLFAACPGTVRVVNPVAVLTAVNATGGASLNVTGPTAPSWCGMTVTGQYAELRTASCPIGLSDALAITIGN
jgi:hypothetical protein